jgi:GNAT superfamily N-acetyltransferase
LEYRILSRAEIGLLVHLDRTEIIDRVYHLRQDTLVLENEHWDVPDWSPSEKQERISHLQEHFDRGAVFFGAFDGEILAGLSVLDLNPLSSGIDRLELLALWVSQNYRHKGIGRNLVSRLVQVARQHGAKSLYVPATPSEHTIRFYRALGFELANPVDAVRLADEPDDIHLELALWDLQGEDYR